MAEDKVGNIWICTEGGGLDLYQPEQGKFKHFNAHTGYHFSTDYLKDVVLMRLIIAYGLQPTLPIR